MCEMRKKFELLGFLQNVVRAIPLCCEMNYVHPHFHRVITLRICVIKSNIGKTITRLMMRHETLMRKAVVRVSAITLAVPAFAPGL